MSEPTTFEEYQQAAFEVARYPEVGSGSLLAITYCTLGLNGEAGEVAEKLKKIIRDKDGVFSDEDRAAIKKELGDVQWYLSALAGELGFGLEDVAEGNIEKLYDRAARDVLHGSGDDR